MLLDNDLLLQVILWPWYERKINYRMIFLISKQKPGTFCFVSFVAMFGFVRGLYIAKEIN